MTPKDMLPKPGFFRERLWIWLTTIAFTALGVFALSLFEPIRIRMSAIWHMPEEMAVLRGQVSELVAGVRRATGEDRVIRQTPGLSYIEEPVWQGQSVTLIMVAERTTLGRDCRLTDWSPLFTDGSGITMPGARVAPGPPRRQITNAPTRLRIEMMPPATLKPGRIEVYLALTYACGGSQIYDRSDPVVYELLAGEKPAP